MLYFISISILLSLRLTIRASDPLFLSKSPTHTEIGLDLKSVEYIESKGKTSFLCPWKI